MQLLPCYLLQKFLNRLCSTIYEFPKVHMSDSKQPITIWRLAFSRFFLKISVKNYRNTSNPYFFLLLERNTVWSKMGLIQKYAKNQLLTLQTSSERDFEGFHVTDATKSTSNEFINIMLVFWYLNQDDPLIQSFFIPGM